MLRVVGVGDNTVDMYVHLGLMFPGGNALNVAALARRFGHQASYLGWLGNDVYGQLILDVLATESIDTTRCRIVDDENGYCEIDLVDGDRRFGASTPGSSTQLALNDDDIAYIARHDLIHTSIHSHIERDLPKLRQLGVPVSFDFSQDWSEDYLSEQLPYVDYAILSYPAQSIEDTERLMRWVHQQGPKLVLVTQGSAGARALVDDTIYHVGVVETDVIDTLGAGDSFIARFLVETLSGAATQDALQRAAQSAAETCTYNGAFGHGAPLVAPQDARSRQ